jgi:ATP-binding cassette subfamily B protein
MSVDRDDVLGRAYDARLIRRLWSFIRPYRGLFWLSVLCLPLNAACMLTQPYLLKLAIDHYVIAGDASGLSRLGYIYVAAIIGECIFFYAQYYLTMLVAQRSLADLRVQVFAHVQRLPMSYFDRNPIGRLVTRLTSDVDVLNEMFAAGAMTIFMDVLTMAGIVLIMVSINARGGGARLMPIMMLGINFFRHAARRTYREIRERIARLNAYLQEALSGMMIIQLFARERLSYAEFRALNDDHRETNHWSNIYEAALFSVVEALASISVALMVGTPRATSSPRRSPSARWSRSSSTSSASSSDPRVQHRVRRHAVGDGVGRAGVQLARLPSPPSPRRSEAHAPRACAARSSSTVWFAYKGEDYVLST